MAKKNIAVKIQDQEFIISTDTAPERVQKLAEFINAKLAEVQSKAKNLSPYRAVLLAALNISENYFNLLDKHNEFKVSVGKKSKKVLQLLENHNDADLSN